MSDLKTCYRYHQKTIRFDVPLGVQDWGGRARFSLVLARIDVAGGTKRYAPVSGDYGPKFEAFGESNMRWMENPEASGLRLVGYADELSSHINHTGWYTDRDFQGEIVRGIVYRLPARKGQEVFAYGYADPHNDGPACLCFDITGDEREAAMFADGIAERMAEEESEHQEAWRACRDYDEADNTISDIRRSTLALIKEIKTICPSPRTYPETYVALREGVKSSIDKIRELRKRRAGWLDAYGAHAAWLDS